MATTQPTVRAAALPAASVQPIRRNIVDVPSNEGRVMPLVGFEVTPTKPTIREETVTKKKAKRPTRIEPASRGPKLWRVPNTCGRIDIKQAPTAPPIPMEA